MNRLKVHLTGDWKENIKGASHICLFILCCFESKIDRLKIDIFLSGIDSRCQATKMLRNKKQQKENYIKLFKMSISQEVNKPNH